MLINNHHLHVETHGPKDGPAVVLLHHGLGSTRAWWKQVPALTKAGFRVVVYDRWGYGGSEPRSDLDAPTFTADLNDLLAIFETLDLKRVAVVGHSDGGTIALYLAILYPNSVACLVMVAAHIYVEDKMETGILGIKQSFEQDQRFREALQRAHGEKYDTTFNNWFQGWHKPKYLEWDLRPRLSEITCPTLVIQGEEDEHATPQHARDIAENLPNAELWLVPNARHMLPQENPETFNRRVLAFLKEVYQGSGET